MNLTMYGQLNPTQLPMEDPILYEQLLLTSDIRNLTMNGQRNPTQLPMDNCY